MPESPPVPPVDADPHHPKAIDAAAVLLPEVDGLDWVLSIIFGLAFLSVLLVFDVIQRIALAFGRTAHDRSIVGLNWSLSACLKLLGTKVIFDRPKNLDPTVPYIIVSNHQSFFDIPLLHSCFPKLRPRFIAKQELSHYIPSVSYNLRNGLNGLIDRSNPRQAVDEIGRVAKLATESRFAIVLFPEGTRARDGKLKQFRGLGFSRLLADLPEAPILPVAIDGAWKLVARSKGPLPRGQTIRIACLDSIARSPGEKPKELLRQIEEGISRRLA